jgi:hypothetical protein
MTGIAWWIEKNREQSSLCKKSDFENNRGNVSWTCFVTSVSK